MVEHYGVDLRIQVQESQFKDNDRTTYAMLCCRFSEDDANITQSQGNHAEVNLLNTVQWTVAIANVLRHWDQFYSSKLVVTLAINRTPCHNCSDRLVEALGNFHRDFPTACSPDNSRFILACRGLYVSTSEADLERLKNAGWDLCVLLFHPFHRPGVPLAIDPNKRLLEAFPPRHRAKSLLMAIENCFGEKYTYEFVNLK